MFNTKCMRIALAMIVALVAWVEAMPAAAQQLMVNPQSQYDRVRVSGFLWRAKPSGTLNVSELADVPGFERGISIGDALGFDSSENGWIFEGNFAAARRHRFIFEYSKLGALGEQSIGFPGVGPIPPVSIDTATTIDLSEFHAFYNFLLVATPQMEFGVLGGFGYFKTDAAIVSTLGDGNASFDTAFPSFGGNVLIVPKGPVRGYIEMSGFPRVSVDDYSGWQFEFLARAEVFAVKNFGVMVGYRRYRLVLDDEIVDAGLDITWSGFTFGAQVRY